MEILWLNLGEHGREPYRLAALVRTEDWLLLFFGGEVHRVSVGPSWLETQAS
jgi:hypothetical protein